jgi:hypothetical protein
MCDWARRRASQSSIRCYPVQSDAIRIKTAEDATQAPPRLALSERFTHRERNSAAPSFSHCR